MNWYLYFVLGLLVGLLAGMIVYKICMPRRVGTFYITSIETDDPYKLELEVNPDEFRRYNTISLRVIDESKKIHSV